MRNHLWFCFLWVGCAATTPEVKLRTPASSVDRLDGAQRMNLESAVDAAKARSLAAQADVTKAETEHFTPAAIEGKPHTPEIDGVVKAAAARHEAFIAWRKSQVVSARWQVAVAESLKELACAEQMAKAGIEIDPAQYRAQSANLQRGHSDADREAARMRVRLDEKERALSAAKDQYAASIRVVGKN
jgi:hypothetical protein